MRRLVARPEAVESSAMGRSLPQPMVCNRLEAIPRDTKYSFT